MQKPIIKIVKRETEGKRPYVIVHPFTGRALPLNHALLIMSIKKLMSKLNFKGADYIVGFAEQGLVPAFAFSQAVKKPLITSTRSRLKYNKTEIHFSEPHSDLPHQYIYGLKKGDTIVIIEDEITTGRTIYNALKAFKKKGVTVLDIGTLIIDGDLKKTKLAGKTKIKPKYVFTREDFSV